MPTFLQFEEGQEEIYIDVDQFFDEMQDEEKQEMFKLLVEEGYRKSGYDPTQLMSIDQQEFIRAIETLENRYYSIPKEDEQTIINIAKKY